MPVLLAGLQWTENGLGEIYLQFSGLTNFVSRSELACRTLIYVYSRTFRTKSGLSNIAIF